MIRYLENNEKQNIRPLYEQIFHDPIEYTNYYFDKCLDKNAVAVNEQEGEIVSSAHLIPKNAVVGTFKTTIWYIYGVCTLEHFRNQGRMKALFSKILNDMYQEMKAFTYLIPSDENNANIYRRLGFEFVMNKNGMKPWNHRRKATHSLILRRAEYSDLIRIAIFAQSSMEKKYRVTLAKDIDYFKRVMELIEIEGGRIEIYVENKVIVGYRIWIDDEIFEEMLDPSIQALSWLDAREKPYAMVRILNIRKTLRLLGCNDFETRILKISDPMIEENNGCFRLVCQHGTLKMDKIEENEIFTEPVIDLTIGELTAHIFGYKIIENLPLVCPKDSFFINDYV